MTSATIQAANQTQADEAEAVIVSMPLAANQYSSGGQSKDNWVLLSPYGNFPNVVGTQHFTKDDALTICNEFDSAPSIGVKAVGLPWYIGHPDHAAFKAQHTDGKAYGRIKELEARDDGLWANVRWSDDGKDLIRSEAFHGHSTNWRMRRNSAGEFHPFSLKSVGFTNEPGIPVPAITAANQGNHMAASKTKKPKLTDYIAQLLGKPEIAANEDDMVGGMEQYAANASKMATDHAALQQEHGALKAAHQVLSTMHNAVVSKYGAANDAGDIELPADVTTAVNATTFKIPATGAVAAMAGEIVATHAELGAKQAEVVAANQKAAAAETKATEAATKLAGAETQAANERKASDGRMLGMLVAGGFITGAERDTYAVELAANEKRDATLVKLVALKPKISTVSSLPGSLGHVSAEIQAANTKKAETADKIGGIVEAVNQYMEEYPSKHGGRKIDYIKAHAHVVKTRPELFTPSEDNITR